MFSRALEKPEKRPWVFNPSSSAVGFTLRWPPDVLQRLAGLLFVLGALSCHLPGDPKISLKISLEFAFCLSEVLYKTFSLGFGFGLGPSAVGIGPGYRNSFKHIVIYTPAIGII